MTGESEPGQVGASSSPSRASLGSVDPTRTARPPRLVATDIDGTILPHGGAVSARTRAALQNSVRQGVPVLLVTGRPPRWLPPVLEATGHRGPVICANGAVVLDGDSRVVTAHAIAPEQVREVAGRLRARVPDVLFAVETTEDLRVESGYLELRGRRRAEGLVPTLPPRTRHARQVEDLLDGAPIVKAVALSPASRPDALLALGRTHLADLVAPTHSSTGMALLELGPLGVSKASTLADVAGSLGVARADVVAFGDMPNDVEMLRWAGRGYAMSGGHPDAVAAAAHVARPAAEDGVARVLEQLLDLPRNPASEEPVPVAGGR
ncbi:HAD-IIB family hydrolase [Georgenia ruanii]|uniref:HAD-IIB family hydrolase n=1 Tax=Georgenia ruanii TaxID=348442 RepID=A0A7J9UTD3_9MICO|nr:HAD-IIB family hydrolase [Georgenia ruanii]